MAIKENIDNINQNLPMGVTLVVAVKYASPEQIKEVSKNVKDLGFNTLQQLQAVKPRLDASIKIHFIGHLQRNKVRPLLELQPYLIQSVDSLRLAEKINVRAKELGVIQKI